MSHAGSSKLLTKCMMLTLSGKVAICYVELVFISDFVASFWGFAPDPTRGAVPPPWTPTSCLGQCFASTWPYHFRRLTQALGAHLGSSCELVIDESWQGPCLICCMWQEGNRGYVQNTSMHSYIYPSTKCWPGPSLTGGGGTEAIRTTNMTMTSRPCPDGLQTRMVAPNDSPTA